MAEVRAVLELLYFASGCGLLVVGVIALQQLKIAKTDMLIRSKRESISFSIAQCESFAKDFLPLDAEIYESLKSNELSTYSDDVGGFCIEEMPENAITFFRNFANKIKDPDTILKVTNITNRLEAFSIYFVKGIADEEVAFASIGAVFCNLVHKYYPFIAIMRSCNDVSPSHKHLIELYNLWQDRLGLLNKEMDLKNAENQFTKLVSELANTDKKTIKPIGVD